MGLRNFFGNLFKKNETEENKNSLENLIESIEDANNGNRQTTDAINEEYKIENHLTDTVDDFIYELEEQLEQKKENISKTAADIMEQVTEKTSGVVGQVKEDLSEKLDNVIDEINEKVADAKEILKEKADDIKEKSENKIEEIKSEIEEKIEQVQEKSEGIIQEVEEKTDELEKVVQEQVTEKKGLFARLKEGLQKTSNSFTQKFDNLFKGYLKIDDDLYEELEEILITSDISFETTIKIVENLKSNIKKKNITDVNLVKPELKEVIYEILSENNSKIDVDDGQSVVIVVGVNGVGKTTTIGKLSSKMKKDGKSVLLAAGDTFRAAAEEQLEIWSKRAGVEIVRHMESGADPSAVIYDAIQKAKSKNIDVLICDTAGRLHNKVNLMNELSKIMRTVNKEHPDAKKEVLLVIDATTGQNALNQVKTFNEAVNLTGVILTKLDGTAKGGVVLSIIDEYKIPVKFIGVGEKVDDLQEFDARNFVDALFYTGEEK